MRAVVCRTYGPPEALRIEEMASPRPGSGEALVDVHAAGVNFADVLVLQNRYQVSASLPFVPGSELAGVVRAVGADAGGFAPGQRVAARMLVGAFAEEVVLPVAALKAVPEGVELRAAAASGVAYGTAANALRSAARLRAGQTLLVLGAAGGVGLAGVQIGRLLGARVIAAASSAEKLAACRRLGAEEVINYDTEDLKERVKALTSGRGVDAVLDPVGGRYAEPAVRATAWRGRYVCVGFAAGEIPRIPLNLLLLKGAELCAFNYGLFQFHDAQEAARNEQELAEWLRSGKLRPFVSASFSLEQAPQALALVAARAAIGKVVIEMPAGGAL